MKQSVVVILIFLIFSTTVKIRANDNSEKKLSDDIRSRIAQSGYEEYLEGQVGYARDFTTNQHFSDRVNVLDKLNGNQAGDDCAARSLNVNPTALYNQVPKVGQCYVSTAEIFDDLAKQPLFRLVLKDNVTLKKAPKEVQDIVKEKYPNGVPQGGINLDLEVVDNVTRIVYMNDNNGLPGDDLGHTANVSLEHVATLKSGRKVGFKGETEAFSSLSEIGEYYNPYNPRQRIVDVTSLKFFIESADVPIMGLTLSNNQSLTWREISSEKRNGIFQMSNMQNKLHHAVNKNGGYAANFNNEDFSMISDNGKNNYGRRVNGWEAGIGLKIKKLLQSGNGRCYMKLNAETEATLSQIPGSSNVKYGGTGEVGYKLGNTTFFGQRGSNVEIIDQKGDKKKRRSEAALGFRTENIGIALRVISEKGAERKNVFFDRPNVYNGKKDRLGVVEFTLYNLGL